MTEKLLWLDTETTGLDPTLHSIIQIGCIIDIDGEKKDEFSINVRPHEDFEIDEKTVNIHGISIEEMKAFPEIIESHSLLINKLQKFIDKFDRNDKFTIAGQNIQFDLNFLSHFFMRINDNFLGSYIDFRSRIELLDITRGMRALGFIESEKVKLGVLCKEFNIEIQAHNALSDIKATRELYYLFKNNVHFDKKIIDKS